MHAVARDWRNAPLSEADYALCAFAARLTHEQHGLQEDDIAELRGHGFDDRAIHDAVQVISLFNYFARVADGLGVEPEDFFRPWGGEP